MSEDSIAAMAAVQWGVVSDSLLEGVAHALGNRLGALAAVTRVLEDAGPDRRALLDALNAEIVQAEALMPLVQLLPRGRSRDAETFDLRDLLTEVVELHSLQGPVRDLRHELDLSADVLAIRAPRTAIAHALLLLLHCAARELQLAGGGVTRIQCTADDMAVTVKIEAVAATGRRHPSQPGEVLDAVDPKAAAALLRWGEAGDAATGEVMVEGDDPDSQPAARFVLRLPSLEQVRRREGAGSSG